MTGKEVQRNSKRLGSLPAFPGHGKVASLLEMPGIGMVPEQHDPRKWISSGHGRVPGQPPRALQNRTRTAARRSWTAKEGRRSAERLESLEKW